MNILIVNPIMYTSETATIKRADSIKDTMIYILCLGFLTLGDNVTLVAGEPYKPVNNEDYPFKVIWAKCAMQKIFRINALPYCPEIRKIAKAENYDLIISSEVFSVNSFALARSFASKTIIWHELASHNKIMHKMPSKIWYSIVARLLMSKALIVPRSRNAQEFISKYCKNVSDTIIDHPVNLSQFEPANKKKNQFIVVSRLATRKRIDQIIMNFDKYLKQYDKSAMLYIVGEGDVEESLKSLTNELGISNSIVFTGKLPHNDIVPILASSLGLLVNTEHDNNMLSIVESIACGTPVLTTDIPYNSYYIHKYNLGIVKSKWNEDDMLDLAKNSIRISNCLKYRENLSYSSICQSFKSQLN